VLDAITFEKLGIPAVVVISMHGYPYVAVPHPFGSLSAAEVSERADSIVHRIEELLRER
jgi:hypothetical protein